MDEFGPLDQDPDQAMDEDEAASLLAMDDSVLDEDVSSLPDVGPKAISYKDQPKTQPKSQPKPQTKSLLIVPLRSPPSPVPHGSQPSPSVPLTHPQDPRTQAKTLTPVKPIPSPKIIQPLKIHQMHFHKPKFHVEFK